MLAALVVILLAALGHLQAAIILLALSLWLTDRAVSAIDGVLGSVGRAVGELHERVGKLHERSRSWKPPLVNDGRDT